ncbi:MAG: AAA family ATPase [Deltaproteobacteria bacterium]|nr:MAG: AAA family ATPase [Deltaproteobacteria bacterium]
MFLKQVNIHSEKFPVLNYYPFKLEIFQNTETVKFNSPVTLFIGENGTGKSTLLKAIAYKCGIHIWQSEFNLRCEKNPYEEDLYKAISTQWKNGPVTGSFFGSQIFSHFAKNLEEWAVNDTKMLNYFGGKSLITQSHGQSLMSYFQSRYNIKGLYFLDEPETALSAKKQLELMKLLGQTSRNGKAQFIIATHSPILMACRGAEIYSFDEVPIEPIRYEQTDHYGIYKDFLDKKEKYLNERKQYKV